MVAALLAGAYSPVGGDVTDAAAASTFTSTTTTVTSTDVNCLAVVWCLANATCTKCLHAVKPHLYNSISGPAAASEEGQFLDTLKSTPSCSPAFLAPDQFIQTLIDIGFNSSCRAMVGIYSDFASACQQIEYRCFVDPNCNTCLSGLYVKNASLPELYESSACTASSVPMAYFFRDCMRFPACSYTKFMCNKSNTCISCWEQLEYVCPPPPFADKTASDTPVNSVAHVFI